MPSAAKLPHTPCRRFPGSWKRCDCGTSGGPDRDRVAEPGPGPLCERSSPGRRRAADREQPERPAREMRIGERVEAGGGRSSCRVVEAPRAVLAPVRRPVGAVRGDHQRRRAVEQPDRAAIRALVAGRERAYDLSCDAVPSNGTFWNCSPSVTASVTSDRVLPGPITASVNGIVPMCSGSLKVVAAVVGDPDVDPLHVAALLRVAVLGDRHARPAHRDERPRQRVAGRRQLHRRRACRRAAREPAEGAACCPGARCRPRRCTPSRRRRPPPRGDCRPRSSGRRHGRRRARRAER